RSRICGHIGYLAEDLLVGPTGREFALAGLVRAGAVSAASLVAFEYVLSTIRIDQARLSFARFGLFLFPWTSLVLLPFTTTLYLRTEYDVLDPLYRTGNALLYLSPSLSIGQHPYGGNHYHSDGEHDGFCGVVYTRDTAIRVPESLRIEMVVPIHCKI